MIVKFMKNQKGGSSKAIDYLLNFRVDEGSAKIIKGNEKLTRHLINDIDRKQKVTVGVLSFEETNLPQTSKFEIMNSFEKVLLPHLSPSQYNILWVEHQDKGRLELNFVIPRVHLQTQKGIQPYFHGCDQNRIDNWKDIVNDKYQLTNPKNISKQRSISLSSRHPFSKDLKALDTHLNQLVKQDKIQNREQLLSYLVDKKEIQLTRVGDNYIGIKLDKMLKAKRFKGGIYSKNFTSKEALLSIQKLKSKNQKIINANISKQDLLQKVIYKIYREVKDNEVRKKLIREFFFDLERERFIEKNMIYELEGSKYRENQAGQNIIAAMAGIGMLEVFNRAVIEFKAILEIEKNREKINEKYLQEER